MTVKAVAKKKDDAPKKEATPKKEEAKKKAAPTKAAVATAPENRAHHATLSESKCSDCAVGLLKQHASESLRNQKKLDPGNQKYHLLDTEEIEFIRTKPLSLQLVGLRRERSLSNKFDDLLVALYDPALLKEGEKTVLEAEGLRKENLESTQSYVDAVLGESKPAAPKNWPLPGADVSCPKCKHWRVTTYPITTEPGYDPKAPNKRDDQGKQIPNYDDLTLLPDEVGAVAPGIYNDSYRVGLHKGTRNPPDSFAALQLSFGSIPARRRYPVGEYLKSAQAAYDSGTDDSIRKALIKKDSKAQKQARTRIETELKKTLPYKTKKELQALAKAVDAKLDEENLETYKPKIAEYRKNAAKSSLNAFKSRIGASERLIRLEDARGAETQNFETPGTEVSPLEVADDDKSPMKICVQLVVKPPPPAPAPAAPPATTATPAAAATPDAKTPATTTPPAPPGPKTLKLTKDDVLVTFGTAAGTNMHRSVAGESGAWSRGREVNNFSEGCQVFRSPTDFTNFMRLAMLSKRAHCPSRTAKCGEKLKVEDVDQGIGANMTAYITKCPDDFADPARDAIAEAFKPPAPPKPDEATAAPKAPATATPDPKAAAKPDPKIQQTIEKLLDASKAYKEFEGSVRSTFLQVFPNKRYENTANFELLKNFTREKTLRALDAKSITADIKTALAKQPEREPKLEDLNEKGVEDDFKNSIATAIEELRKKLTETKTSWVKQQQADEIVKKHGQYLAEASPHFGGRRASADRLV